MGFLPKVSFLSIRIHSQYTTSNQLYNSVPAGAIALVLLLLAMPASFPYKPESSDDISRRFNMVAVRKIDFLGGFLLLSASLLFVSAVEEGGTEYVWKSSVVLSLLCLSIVLWILFFAWQKTADRRQDTHEPVLPWRLLQDRFTVGFLL